MKAYFPLILLSYLVFEGCIHEAKNTEIFSCSLPNTSDGSYFVELIVWPSCKSCSTDLLESLVRTPTTSIRYIIANKAQTTFIRKLNPSENVRILSYIEFRRCAEPSYIYIINRNTNEILSKTSFHSMVGTD